jgi:hypothetical protein
MAWVWQALVAFPAQLIGWQSVLLLGKKMAPRRTSPGGHGDESEWVAAVSSGLLDVFPSKETSQENDGSERQLEEQHQNASPNDERAQLDQNEGTKGDADEWQEEHGGGPFGVSL